MKVIRRATAYGWERRAVAFLEPGQEALLEKVGCVGVVVGTRRVDEHVADAGVPVDMWRSGVAKKRFERSRGDPVVGVRDMHAESHVEAPVAAEIAGRETAGDEHESADPVPLLSKELSRKCAEREADHGVGVWVLAGGPARDLFDRVVPDAAREREALVEPPKDDARVHVGRVNLMASRSDALSQLAQALGEALSVMEEDDFGDIFSVRLSDALRQPVTCPVSLGPCRGGRG